MSNMETRLKNCFAAVLPDLGEDEILRATTVTVTAWDSEATVTLLTVVEEEFCIRIPPDDIVRFVSFEEVLDYIRSRGDAR